jgi:hypothetical protein
MGIWAGASGPWDPARKKQALEMPINSSRFCEESTRSAPFLRLARCFGVCLSQQKQKPIFAQRNEY